MLQHRAGRSAWGEEVWATLWPCFTLLQHPCLPHLFSADPAVADLQLFASSHPADVKRRCRSPVGGPIPSTQVRTLNPEYQFSFLNSEPCT